MEWWLDKHDVICWYYAADYLVNIIIQNSIYLYNLTWFDLTDMIIIIFVIVIIIIFITIITSIIRMTWFWV